MDKDAAIRELIPLAEYISEHYVCRAAGKRFVDRDELYSVALAGAFLALDRYNPERGTLITFCKRRMWGEVKDHLRRLNGYRSKGAFYEHQCLSLDAPVVQRNRLEEPMAAYSDLIDNSEPGEDVRILGMDMRKFMDVANLNKRERMMLESYYWNGELFNEIAQRFGVNESRISQIHKRAIEKLRLAAICVTSLHARIPAA